MCILDVTKLNKQKKLSCVQSSTLYIKLGLKSLKFNKINATLNISSDPAGKKKFVKNYLFNITTEST